MGIGFTVNIAVNGGENYTLDATTVLIISLSGLLLVLLFSLSYVIFNKFKISRPYASSASTWRCSSSTLSSRSLASRFPRCVITWVG